MYKAHIPAAYPLKKKINSIYVYIFIYNKPATFAEHDSYVGERCVNFVRIYKNLICVHSAIT